MDGVIHLTPDFDMIGAFGRSPADLRDLACVLLDRFDLSGMAEGGGVKGLRIGFADPRVWGFGEEYCWSEDPGFVQRQIVEIYEGAVRKLKGRAETVYPVVLPDPGVVMYKEDGREYGFMDVSCKLSFPPVVQQVISRL